MSNDDLKVGEDGELLAEGIYDAASVDDRAGVDFLVDSADSDPPGRNPGIPIDVAIYLASSAANVYVGSPVSIESEGTGAMVVDAYDTVSFGSLFEDSLEGIGWLEICSRITGSMNEAVYLSTLPYADGSGPEAGYVLRGEKPDVGTGAWVLDAILPPLPPVTPHVPVAPLPETVEFEVSGCLALMNWASHELAIEAGIVQIWMVNTLASARDMNPCNACAALKGAATILQDTEGTHIAALAQLINEFASSTTPPSEEQMASIADAIARNTEPDSQYAIAGEYLDALAEYVGILDSEMGFSAEEAVEIATNNYIRELAEGENVGLTAYIAARLAALGG